MSHSTIIIFDDNAIKLQTIAKRNFFNLKVNAKLVNKLHNGAIQSIVVPKIQKLSNNIQQSMVISAEGDTWANVSATNINSTIHDYWEYKLPIKVGVFSEETKKE